MNYYSLYEKEQSAGNYTNANIYLMYVIGELLVKDRENFVHLLKECGVEANITDSDAVIINKYVNNLINRKLLLGTAILIETHNKKMSFDGTDTDSNVNEIYNTMKVYYIDDNYSNAVDPVGAIAEAVAQSAKLGTAITGRKAAKESRPYELLAQKSQAKQALVENALKTRQAQIDQETKEKEQSEKTKRYLIIGGAVVLVGVLAFYFIKKRGKK
jgi:hypothetical protein